MRQARAQRGQILPIVAVALVALLGLCAFSIDVGYAYYAQRQLQAATDASALAGAQDLPTTSTALTTAVDYAKANSPTNLPAFAFTYQLKCTATAIIATGCNASVNPNELLVAGSGQTDTWFAGLFGIKHFGITAHANACSPCSSTPVDIVIALDRTGSMCRDPNDNSNCSDMNNAKEGVRTMLGILNPPAALVGLVAFPPLQSTASLPCDQPFNSTGNGGWDGYDAPGRGYVTDTLTGKYKDSQGAPVTGSGLYAHLVPGPDLSNSGCIASAGSTSYSEALRQSYAELLAHGRPNVPNYIVFMSDGEANLGSVYPKVNGVNDPVFFPGNADDRQPCATAKNVATTIKNAGVTIYTIGYALGQKNCTAGQWRKRNSNGSWSACTALTSGCQHFQGDPNNSGELESPALTSYNTLSAIASPGDFHNQAAPGDVTAIFAAIATDIGQGSSRLVEDSF